jgi:hypothetical protein
MADAYDRVDLHDKIMQLLKGRIAMGAARKKRAAPKKRAVKRKAPVKRKTPVKRKRAAPRKKAVPMALKDLMGLLAQGGDEGGDEGGVRRRKRRVRARGVRAGNDGGDMMGTAKRRRVHKRAGATSPWVEHVKDYARAHGCSYGDAMSRARATYRG